MIKEQCKSTFYYIRTDKRSYITAHEFIGVECLPILWNNAGLFGLIPLGTVRNAVKVYEDTKLSPGLNSGNYSAGTIYWDEILTIDVILAGILLGK